MARSKTAQDWAQELKFEKQVLDPGNGDPPIVGWVCPDPEFQAKVAKLWLREYPNGSISYPERSIN